MNFYQVKIMMPLSYTIQANDMKDAEALSRKLAGSKTQKDDLVPFLHSVIELREEDGPHGQPHNPAAA